MSIRAVINVATTPLYLRGQARLKQSILEASPGVGFDWRAYTGTPTGRCPPHAQRPYAFKAYALEMARRDGMQTLLWCDSSIVCLRDLRPLFERIERDGYWIANNGWTNYEWTADSAYEALFPAIMTPPPYPSGIVAARLVNRTIRHVVATAFGISVQHPIGRAILDQYFHLASETIAFCGPWTNAAYDGGLATRRTSTMRECGPADVRGHRHDQTALSVIAWRLGCELTSCPDIFAYYDGRCDSTILAAKMIE